MLRDTKLLVKIASEVVKATSLPVTVKTRLGWDNSYKNITEIAERLQDVGIKAITIHGRTGVQLYKGTADWTLIGEVKNNPKIKIPVIGNGDITTPEKAKENILKYGIDGIMIGRATIGYPWIFKDIRYFLDTGTTPVALSVTDKVAIAKQHFLKSIELKGEPRGIYEMRRHFVNYFKALPNFRETKIRLLTSLDIDEIKDILDEIKSTYHGY